MSAYMSRIVLWTESPDAVLIQDQGNGVSRGDEYDISIFWSRSTGRYIVITGQPGRADDCWIATSLAAAQAVAADGYTPGCGPGQYRWIADARRIREVREVCRRAHQ